jgi:hypothetical protein
MQLKRLETRLAKFVPILSLDLPYCGIIYIFFVGVSTAHIEHYE